MKQNSKILAEMEENDKNSGNGTYTCESLQHIIAETVGAPAGLKQARRGHVDLRPLSSLGLRPLPSISGFRDLTSDL
jgi:hypothetical protein